MALWLLKRKDAVGYDEAAGFVISADDETSAREIASGNGGDENRSLWLDSGYVSCREITKREDSGVILRDYKHG